MTSYSKFEYGDRVIHTKKPIPAASGGMCTYGRISTVRTVNDLFLYSITDYHGYVVLDDVPEQELEAFSDQTTTMTSSQTTQKTFKVGDRVVHKDYALTVTTVKGINSKGYVDTDMFNGVIPEHLTLYVDPSTLKTHGVFQIGDKVQVKETSRVFVISDAKFSNADSNVPWFKPSELEHYSNEKELAEIDKQIMKLIETKAKLINETKK